MRKYLLFGATALLLLAGSSLNTAAFAGSICKDGSYSPSEGRGTCSSHGGVATSGVPAPAPVATPVPVPTPTPTPSPALSQPSIPQVAGSAWASLVQQIPVRQPLAVKYSRAAFKLWTKQPDGCTTREEVLIQEKQGGLAYGCTVSGATWYSPYDGRWASSARDLDIDHMVPLKEAWISGASAWSPAMRTAFANDLSYDNSLIAVTASSNRSKGDRDPAKWMPPNGDYHCTYVQSWVSVKAKWKLAMDAAERAKVDSVLGGCPDVANPIP